MSFGSFSEEPISTLIEEVGAAGVLTLMVGAGASMEAGLPSWDALVKQLLLRAAREHGLIDVNDVSAAERWQAEAARDGYLGAAAIVDALAGADRDTWLNEELFARASGPQDFFPGPISRQLPGLSHAFGRDLRVMTTNYDDLLEQAFREDGASEPVALATSDHSFAAGSVPIYHLHGYLGRDGRDRGDLVLSEADYQRMQRGASSWQADLVRTALRDSTVLFVGTSLIDPNLIRYLHDVLPDGGVSSFAVFVRQGAYPPNVPAGIPPARERALAARWEALGVTPVFVDHYVEVAQVLAEVARRREAGGSYVPLPDRARDWVDTVHSAILGIEEEGTFERGQRTVRSLLRSALDQAVDVVERIEGRPFDETLACSLWLVDRDGEHLTSWVTTDRLHIDRATIDPVPIDEHSRWVAVRACCRGTALAEPRDIYASRWHFIRATPLVVDTARHGRIPVGCLTTASMKGRADSRLATMASDVAAEFNESLSDPVLRLLDRPFA